jgi:hypothetical protein
MSPISSPLVPWITVLRWQTSSVTILGQTLGLYTGKWPDQNLHADMVTDAVTPPSNSMFTI